MDRLTELQRRPDDLADVAVVTARLMLASPHRFSLDDVLDRFGSSREELRRAGKLSVMDRRSRKKNPKKRN
jgi:hypothetical protein